MIENYFRPNTLEEAVQLLKKDEISTYPLGGGNVLSHFDTGKISVVDLQNLKIDKIHLVDNEIKIGANTTLQEIIENANIPKGLKDAVGREAPINIRQTATLAGTLVSSKGNSPLAVAMLIAGAQIIIEPGSERIGIDQWFTKLDNWKPSRLVVSVDIPKDIKVFYMDVSKTPSDFPIVFSAIGVTNTGKRNWGIGVKKEKNLFIASNINSENAKAILENAHRHLTNSNIQNNYIKQVIEVLFHRLIAEADKG